MKPLVRNPIPLCERCAEVRWRTGTLPGSRGNTHPSRIGRHVKLARSCRDCGKQAYRLYANAPLKGADEGGVP